MSNEFRDPHVNYYTTSEVADYRDSRSTQGWPGSKSIHPNNAKPTRRRDSEQGAW